MVKKLFKIKIDEPCWEGYRYALFYGKQFGDQHGGATEFKTKKELIDFVKETFREWEKPDSISKGLSQTKVSRENLDFTSFTPEISGGEFFGDKSLFDY